MPESIEATDPFGILDGHTPTEFVDSSEEEKKTYTRLEECFRKAREWRDIYDQEWDIAVQYAKGRQFRYRHRETGEIIYTDGLLERNKTSQLNAIRAVLRSLVGKLAALQPSASVRPATMDVQEVYAADVATKWLDYFREVKNLDLVWLQIQEDVGLFGNGWAYTGWDENAGDEVSFCPHGDCGFVGDCEMVGQPCPNCEMNLAEAQTNFAMAATIDSAATEGRIPPAPPPDLGEAPALLAAKTGDIKCARIDPRRVYVQPGAECIQEADYIILEFPMTVAQLRMEFPEHALRIKASAGLHNTGIGSMNDVANLSAAFTYTGAYDEHMEDRTYKYEYHEAPSQEWPSGRIITFCEGVILSEVESPYFKLIGRFPLFHFRWTVNPSELLGEGAIVQAWHRQKELNTMETIMREHAELSTRWKWLIPLGSKIKAEELSPMASQAIQFNAAAGEPRQLTPPPLPPEAYNRRQVLLEDIRFLFGVTATEAGLGQPDPNGRAMALIEAENDQQIGPITKRNNVEWKLFLKAVIQQAIAFYSPEKQFTLTGEDVYGETYDLAEMNLSTGWDLVLEIEDGFSRNRAVRTNEAFQMMGAGLLGQPGMPDTLQNFAKIAKVRIPGLTISTRDPDVAAAREKLAKIERGIPVDPFTPWDDPAVYAEQFLLWLKTKGRMAPPGIVQQVSEMWMYFTQWAMMRAQGMGTGMEQGANQMIGSVPGTSMSAPGGTPQGLDSQLPGQSQTFAQADQMVNAADQAGERAAGVPEGSHEN